MLMLLSFQQDEIVRVMYNSSISRDMMDKIFDQKQQHRRHRVHYM